MLLNVVTLVTQSGAVRINQVSPIQPSRAFQDFGLAVEKIVDCAVEEQVQVCLLAGNLFHKSSIDPATLIQAEAQLSRLHDHGIVTIAISGNHDRPRYRQAKT